MADPRRVSTKRAVLSYDHLKRLTDESGLRWPDLLIKDYQGIIQDFVFLADSDDEIELSVEGLQLAIDALESRVEALEYKAFTLSEITEDYTTSGNEILICKNTAPINITLNPLALPEDEIHIKRRGAQVTEIGTIDGKTNRVINIEQWSDHLVFDGTDWSVI